MKYKGAVFGLIAFFCLFAVDFGTANALSVAYPANGLYSLQPQCAPNKELTVENASTNNGANVFLWSINSNWHTQPSHQKWYIERIGNSEWYIIKAENSGKCLNVDGGAAKDFTNITLWQRTDENQTFRFFDAGNGNYIIQGHTHDGFFVLDVYYAGNADGTNVTNCGYNGSPAQIWKLVRRNPSSQGNKQQNNSNYDEKVRNFINDSRFRHGTSWTAGTTPKMSGAGNGSGCNAYARDFVKYVFGTTLRGAGSTQFTNINEIRAGDVIYVSPSDHWIVVLYRNGDNLTTAEGNWGGKVVVGDTYYKIQNGNIYHRNSSNQNYTYFRPFKYGFHHK